MSDIIHLQCCSCGKEERIKLDDHLNVMAAERIEEVIDIADSEIYFMLWKNEPDED